MYNVIKRSRLYNLSIDCQLDLFDKMVMPILLYGCEIWGFSNCDILERVHLKFCKLILNVKKSTPNFIVYGELARYPISVYVKTRIIGFWANIVTGKQTKYSFLIYNMLYNKFLKGINFGWFMKVKSILDECGMSNILHCQNFNKKWLVKSVKLKLCDQFQQKWSSDCNNSSKGISYRLFTNDFQLQYYLRSNLCKKNKIILSKFRTSNHRLPIENGRWQNIDRNERLCNLCQDEIGDEYHYIFKCTSLTSERNKYIPILFSKNPNIVKFYDLFSSKKMSVLNNLCKFISIINERVSPPG